jgi:hypothetical protein
MASGTNKPGKCDQKVPPSTEFSEQHETKRYNPWDDGFRVSLLLLLAIGLPLFLASLYFVLYAIFDR